MRMGKLNIRPGFFILLALFMMLDRENLCLHVLFSVILHELAHYLLLRFYGGEVSEICLGVIGIGIKMKNHRLISYFAEILIYLAGPVINLLAALLFSILGRNLGYEAAYLFAGMNITIGLFNILPIRGLDGGRALSFLLEWIFGTGSAIPQILTVFFALMLAAFGIWVFAATGFNFTMMIIGLWILLKPGKGLEKRSRNGYNTCKGG